SDRLVEDHFWQASSFYVLDKLFPIFEMPYTISGVRSKALKIVEGLMMRLEVGASIFSRINHLTFFARWLASVSYCGVPATGIPGPSHLLFAQSVANSRQC